MTNPTPPNYPTLADLEQLADNLALTPDDKKDNESCINANMRVRKQFKFWLDGKRGDELALMQYLLVLKANYKMKTFINLALRYAILDYSTSKHYDKDGEPNVPFEYADDIKSDIEWLLDNIDWGRE